MDFSENNYYRSANRGFIVDTDRASAQSAPVALYPFDAEIKIFDGTRTRSYFNQNAFTYVKSYEQDGEETDVYTMDGLTVEFKSRRICNSAAVRCRTALKNNGDTPVRICKLTSLRISGIFGDMHMRKRNALRLCSVRSTWGGEGQLTETDIDDAHISRTCKRDAKVVRALSSATSYTTDECFPLLFFRDTEKSKCWFAALEPQGRWEMRVGMDCVGEYETLSLQALTGEERKDGYFRDIPAGGVYFTPYAVFGCVNGGIEEAVHSLNVYRRSLCNRTLKEIPVVFNDYLNCHWARPGEERTKRLVDAVATTGAEVFCIDSGWYKEPDSDWFGKLGDWKESDFLFGADGFQGMIDYIRRKGMLAGMWFELEVCTPSAEAADKPDDWFLKINGKRVFEYGRYYFDLRNREVREYLVGRVAYFYKKGIRYIKNDYNGTFAGCEALGVDIFAGLEDHSSAVKNFYRELKAACPGLIIENCCSGAMRADYTLLSECELQSVSDLEMYEKYPAVIGGSLLNLLPEQTGIWSVCYPQVYAVMENEAFADGRYRKEMSDGEQTVYNMVSGFMGAMYLSGRMELADEHNLALVREAVETYKKYRTFIAAASPVYPTGRISYGSESGMAALGLKNGTKILLAVWHRKGGETSFSIPAETATLVYPKNKETEYEFENGTLTVCMERDYQARLFEIET